MKKTLLASLVCVVALAGCNQKEETVAPTQSQSEAKPYLQHGKSCWRLVTR